MVRRQPRHTHCKRGHRLEGANAVPHPNGGRRCRACNAALAMAHNAVARHGQEPWPPSKIQQYADWKYWDLGLGTYVAMP